MRDRDDFRSVRLTVCRELQQALAGGCGEVHEPKPWQHGDRPWSGRVSDRIRGRVVHGRNRRLMPRRTDRPGSERPDGSGRTWAVRRRRPGWPPRPGSSPARKPRSRPRLSRRADARAPRTRRRPAKTGTPSAAARSFGFGHPSCLLHTPPCRFRQARDCDASMPPERIERSNRVVPAGRNQFPNDRCLHDDSTSARRRRPAGALRRRRTGQDTGRFSPGVFWGSLRRNADADRIHDLGVLFLVVG